MLLVRGCDQIEMAIISTRLPGFIFFGHHVQMRGPRWFWIVNTAGRFQTFEFRFCNFKFFWIKATGFCKNWGWLPVWMWCSTPWVGVGITSPVRKMEGNFWSKCFMSAVTESGIGKMKWVRLPAKQKKAAQKPVKIGQKRWGSGQDRRCTSKENFACLWSNSDSELSQEVNAQKRTCHCCLQKLGSKKFALKLDGFLNKSPRGDWLSIRPL